MTCASLTSRCPEKRELEILDMLFESQRKYFENNPSAADEYLSVGHMKPEPEINRSRLAAMTIVGNTLMSYDDCVTKR